MKVQERTVKRWFFPKLTSTGKIVYKSYGTKQGAYRALAREVLFDEVFGLKEEFCMNSGTDHEYCYWTRPGFKKIDDDYLPFKAEFAKAMLEFGFECSDDYPYGEGYCCNETIGFCVKAYNKWLDAKAAELKDQEE